MIDLHTHTTASDGSLAPAALIDAARAAGLRVISITDHDTTAGFETVMDTAARAGVELVPGIEISAVGDGRDVHVLGYFIDPSSSTLRAFLARQRCRTLELGAGLLHATELFKKIAANAGQKMVVLQAWLRD